MSEAKDPAIKLFGKTIPLPDIPPPPSAGPPPPPLSDSESLNLDRSSSPEDDKSSRVGEDHDPDNKAPSGGSLSDTKQVDGARPIPPEEIANPTTVVNENPKTPSVDNEAATLKASKTEEEQSETSNSQEKTLKKPDKILPCPRCNSMDTKFCYYNNYNVNQPRHFCKNCQRYWTAGGTMRNVPVGAGRRKNKNSASHYRHIAVSEALQNARADLPNGIHHSTLKPNGTVLTFGSSDTPLCESMASVLNIAEKTMRNCAQTGFRKPEKLIIPVSYVGGENGDDHSSGSSVTAANSKDDVGSKTGLQDPVMQNCHSFPPQVPCFPGPPWPYPWNSAQWSGPVPVPAFCPPGFPMPFYPPPYWGCTIPGTWNVPWVTPPSSSPNHIAPSSGPNSPTLGKHSRDENMLKQTKSGEEDPHRENNPERSLWIPKTLRIDDPGEAAKSSIWATLGIKNDKVDSVSGGGLFKPFQPKGDDKSHVSETSPVLQANPAALSRSLDFHESS